MTKNISWMADNDTAFIVVDMTYDFLPGGALAAPNCGLEIIPVINEVRQHFNNVVWTKERHAKNHQFFASSHPGKKPRDTVVTDFGTQFLWPDHCVEGTKGEEFHEDLDIRAEDKIVTKGTDPTIHAYSAFYMDDRKTIITYEDGKTLTQKLQDLGIKKVVVCGLLEDFCAGLTAWDAKKEGFESYFLADATDSLAIPVSETDTTLTLMRRMFDEAGVKVITSTDLAFTLGKVPSVNLATPKPAP